jgi:hypothetical protein
VGQDGDIVHLMVTDTALDRLNTRLAGSNASPAAPSTSPGTAP